MRQLIKSKYLLIIALFTMSCASTISLFDQFSYKETISAKVEALALMDKATQDYDSQKESMESVLKAMNKVYEYEKNRPKNVETTKMWEILLDPNKKLFGGFLEKWKVDTTESQAFIDQAKKQVEDAFDIIIDLENKKIKPEDANSFINKY